VRRVFVETNWVVDYAAPSPFRVEDAIELLARARSSDVCLHLPAVCLVEAQPALWRRYEPRETADSVRQFLKWARLGNVMTAEEEDTVRTALDRFESQVRNERQALASVIDALRREPNVELFALCDAMLERTILLSTQGLSLQPFDLSILAAVLVRSGELLKEGESDLAFCELDKDLQPWDRAGQSKQPLADLYDSVHLWVYGDFALKWPEKPTDWPANRR
jgi:hypothetical protein